MGDFIELGLEGCDKLIDKHFHKIPNKYVDPHTYKPSLHRHSKDQQRRQSVGGDSDYKQQSRQRQRSPSPLSPFSEYPPPPPIMSDYNGRPRGDANSSQYVQDGPFINPPFSTMPPVQRSEYSPSSMREGREVYYAPSRPTQMRRRSSSYHGPRHSEQFYSSSDSDDDRRRGKQLATRERTTSHKESSKNGHHNLKDEVADQFTKSKEGLAGGALGALVGGWAAHKALESRGKGSRDADKAWTLLGAAVGGLAVNSIVDKFEDRKEEKREAEKRRSRDGGSERSRDGRSDRGRRDYDDSEEERRYYR